MMLINPPQSFDWTVRNLHKAFNEWLEEVNLFLEFRNLNGRVEIEPLKLQMLKRKKKKFVYLPFRKKGSTNIQNPNN